MTKIAFNPTPDGEDHDDRAKLGEAKGAMRETFEAALAAMDGGQDVLILVAFRAPSESEITTLVMNGCSMNPALAADLGHSLGSTSPAAGAALHYGLTVALMAADMPQATAQADAGGTIH